jgi:hypothetical protein
MALLTVQPLVAAGLEVTYAAVAASDTVRPDDRTFLHVVNGSGADVEVTLTCEGTCSFGSNTPTHDRVVDVTAGESRMIPTGPTAQFADATTGLVTVTYEATTSVTIAAIRV